MASPSMAALLREGKHSSEQGVQRPGAAAPAALPGQASGWEAEDSAAVWRALGSARQGLSQTGRHLSSHREEAFAAPLGRSFRLSWGRSPAELRGAACPDEATEADNRTAPRLCWGKLRVKTAAGSPSSVVWADGQGACAPRAALVGRPSSGWKACANPFLTALGTSAGH